MNTTTSAVAFGLGAAVAIGVTFTGIAGAYEPVPTQNTRPVTMDVLEEDEPGWNCPTMGSHQCGDDAPSHMVTVPAHCVAVRFYNGMKEVWLFTQDGYNDGNGYLCSDNPAQTLPIPTTGPGFDRGAHPVDYNNEGE